MKKKTVIIGLIIVILLVIIISASGNKQVSDSFNKGMKEGKTTVQTPTPSSQNVGQQIQEALTAKNLKVLDVNYAKPTNFVAIKLTADAVLSNTEDIQAAWKALYITYSQFPDINSYGVAVMQDNNKILQIDASRKDVRQSVAGYTTETDKLGVEAGTMRYVKPILQKLNVTGHPELMAVIGK